jgi:hypothetical protein
MISEHVFCSEHVSFVAMRCSGRVRSSRHELYLHAISEQSATSLVDRSMSCTKCRMFEPWPASHAVANLCNAFCNALM